MLNLGDLISRIPENNSDIDFENAYLDWLELYNQNTNFLNAIEIVEKARATNSEECIKFAEELLGCSLEDLEASMEVKFRMADSTGRTMDSKDPNSGKKGSRVGARYAHIMYEDSPEYVQTINLMLRLRSKLGGAKTRLTEKELNKKVFIPIYVKALAMQDVLAQNGLRINRGGARVEFPLKTAISMYERAIHNIHHGSKMDLKTKAIGKFDTKSEYKDIRNIMARFLIELRKFVFNINKMADDRINS